MNYKVLLMAVAVLGGTNQVLAQANKLPVAVNIPNMAFDKPLLEKATVIDQDNLPTILKVGAATISIGSTPLTEITTALKTGVPLHNGKGYYQCYSLPRYSHQLWFFTKGNDLTAPVTEVVLKLGNILPTDYCPLITATSYPVFTNKMRLEFKPSLVNTLLGKPLYEKGAVATYLIQLNNLQKLKVQTQKANKGLVAIKVTQESLVY